MSDDPTIEVAVHAAPAVRDDVLEKGAHVGRYVVEGLIGEGGMGLIYIAYDPQLDRQVALKLLRTAGVGGTEGSEGQARLLREAQAMAQLSHPNVMPVYDVGPHGRSVFVAMELVRGPTLRRWLSQKPRTWAEVLDVFIQAGRGLAAAHKAGLVHRDFKPSNVLIGEDGRPRVADFGIVRSTRAPVEPVAPRDATPLPTASLEAPLTLTGSVLGSPGYMAPEQYTEGASTPASDQFAFCVALHEALYGARPFVGPSLVEVMRATMEGRLPPAPKGTAVPTWVRRLVEQGLAVDPARRHPSMAALLTALSNDPARVTRRRASIAAALAVVLGCVALVGALQWRQSRACRGAELKLAGVWDTQRAEQGARAFEATGKPYAQRSWTNARAALDAYARAWTLGRTRACEATRIQGEQTEEQLQLRMTCLDRRLDELGALTAVFATADAIVVDQSADAVGRLSPLDACANVKGLAERRQVPAEGVAEADRLGQALAEGRALVATGKYGPAREKVGPVLAKAQALKLPGIAAEALHTLGDLENQTSNWAAARAAWEQAVQHALGEGDDPAAARTLVSLVSLVGWRLERPDEGRMLAAIATGLLARIGGDARIEAQLAEGLGDVAWQTGARAEALVKYREALAATVRLQGPQSPDVARLKSDLGWVLMEQGALVEARAELEQSRAIREAVLGADHPALGSSWSELASLADALGDMDEAVRCMERALAIDVLAKGEDSVGVARKRLGLAVQLTSAGRAAEAVAPLRLAQDTIARRPEAPPSTRVLATRTAAKIEADLGRPAEAVKLGQEALTTAEATHGRDHPLTALAALDLAHYSAAVSRHAEALALFDRFLADEGARGSASADIAVALSDSAASLLALGRTKEGLERLERAVALLPYAQGNAQRAAQVHFALAQALWSTGTDKPRARALALEAQPKFKAGKDAKAVADWIAKH